MKGDIGRKIEKWRNLTRGKSHKATEEFLKNNAYPDSDLDGFFRERSEAGSISRHGSLKNAQNYVAEKNQKYIQLKSMGIPEQSARLMMKNPDFIDLPVKEIISHYKYFTEQGVSETAAATFACTDYAGRGKEGLLKKIAVDYHVAKSGGIISELPFYILRYKNVFDSVFKDKEKRKELGLVFYVLDGLDGDDGIKDVEVA